MCKSHHPKDLAPGIVVIQNEFLSLLLPCAGAGVTACYKPVENGSGPCAGEVGQGGLGGCVAVPSPGPCIRGLEGQAQGCGGWVWCLGAAHPDLCLSVSGELRRAELPRGLIGKMSDMLKVALGFMQSQ